jgi:hypothetical protein
MAITVKKATLWRRELSNKPHTLADTLKPFAKAGVNLQLIMGYTFPAPGQGAVEVFPITDAKAEECAKEAGLAPAKDISCVLVEGDDRAGIGFDIADAVGTAGINLHFAMCQVVGQRYSGVFGFGSEADAEKAEKLIKQVCEVASRA